MKLFYSPNSPYARIARISLREYGLLERVQEITAINRSPDNPLLEYSPVGKVPTLVADQLVISDTRLVCQFIQHLSGDENTLTAENRNWCEDATEGLIMGFLEGIASWVRELRRSEVERSLFLIDVERARAQRCLFSIENEVEFLKSNSIPNFARTAIASALSLMEMHKLVPNWQTEYPSLASWQRAQEQRTSMMETAPQL